MWRILVSGKVFYYATKGSIYDLRTHEETKRLPGNGCYSVTSFNTEQELTTRPILVTNKEGAFVLSLRDGEMSIISTCKTEPEDFPIEEILMFTIPNRDLPPPNLITYGALLCMKQCSVTFNEFIGKKEPDGENKMEFHKASLLPHRYVDFFPRYKKDELQNRTNVIAVMTLDDYSQVITVGKYSSRHKCILPF